MPPLLPAIEVLGTADLEFDFGLIMGSWRSRARTISEFPSPAAMQSAVLCVDKRG